jgi:dienelactone hydrolase
VVVIGASMGGTAVVTAAGTPTSGINGVVSISAPASYLSADAEAAAAHVKVPVLFAASRSDQSYAQVAQTMSKSCGCAYPKVFLFDGSLHGIELLRDTSDGPPLRAGIDQLLARAMR